MNCSIIHRVGILFMAAMVVAVNSIFAQCGFQTTHANGCKGTFILNLTDTTTGATSTCWYVQLPQGSTPANDTSCNSQLFSLNSGLVGVMPGTVIVTMTDMVGGQPCTHTDSFFIYPNPVIHGALSTTVTCAGGCVYWYDSTSWGAGCTMDSFLIDWRNNQGFQPSPVPQCEVYDSNGSYQPAIILINSCGCRTTGNLDSILVTAPPSASFSGPSLYSCTSPFSTTLTAGSNAPNTRYSWYVDTSGGTFSATPKQATGSNTFTYPYPAGTWSVKLVVLGLLSGCTDSVIQTNYVTAGNNPAACITATTPDTTGCWGTRTFCPCPDDSVASSFKWTFSGAPGTFSPANGVNNTTPACVNPSFFAAGYYQARLIVGYPGGCYDTTTITNIHIGVGVPLSFSTPDTVFCTVPVTVCMTYTGTACAACSFRWSAGASADSSHTGTCYTLTSYQQFSPGLTVIDAAGCATSLVKYFYITDMPLDIIVNKTYANGDGCTGDTIVINNMNSVGGPFASVTWSFPGATVISQNSTIAKVKYSSTGCHPYSLIMKSMTGCIDTLRDSICIQPKPVVTMTMSPHDLCYEKKPNIFYVDTLPPNPAPTSVQVWPEGIKTGGGPSFIIPKYGPPNMNFDSFPYMYQDWGNFAFCYLANNGGCLGDTTCLTAPADSVHIFPPAPSFNMIPNCTSTLTRVLTNTSTGQDSVSWSFNGVNYYYPADQASLTVTFPQCGVKYPVSITAFRDTIFSYMDNGVPVTDTGCWLTKSDSIFAPCYETDFNFAITKGCDFAYGSEAGIYFTGPNALKPTQVIWDAVPVGTPPVFGCCPNGDTILYYLNVAGVYNAYVQLTYPNGCIDTLFKSKYIDISQPTAGYTSPDTVGCVPYSVHFTNTSTVVAGAIASFSWVFGDGAVDNVHFSPVHIYTTSGRFQACLTIVDTNGCTNTFCRQIQADDIQAGFTETDSITCLKNSSPLNPLTYTSTSTGIQDSLIWLLPAPLGPVPNHITGNQSSITEQYTVQGTDSIGLVAMDQYGKCRDTLWKPIRVANPKANYGLPSPGDTFFTCPPVPLCLVDSSKNDICTWNYILGDGFTDLAQNPCHIWQYAGLYPITQIVTSCHGCSDTITRDSIRIAGATVTTSVDKTGGCSCTTITWTFSTIGTDSIFFTSDGGTPLFEDIAMSQIGTPAHPSDTFISVKYCNTGNIQPIMSAHSPGCSAIPFPITPVFIDTPNTVFADTLGSCGTDSVCFTNLSTFNAPQARDSINIWNFGDGTLDTTFLNPCHHFPGPGDYTVTLTVSDQLLCATADSIVVHIPAHPHAGFMVDDSVGCKPFLVHFTDTSHVDTGGTAMTGYWNFGDGTIAYTTADTSHIYDSVALFTATLVITDGYGCTDSAKQTIQVSGHVNIVMGPDQTICLGDTANLSVSGGAVYHWTPYNISDTMSATPRVWPTADTQYIVKIGTAALCVEYDSVYIKVAHFTVSLDTATNVCGNQVTTFTASAQVTHDSIISYSWSFGDASPSVSGDSVATHQYATFGTYSDTLIVTSLLGCKDTVVGPVTIFDIPHAAFSLSGDTVCVGLSATVTNNSTPGSGALAGFTFYTPAVSTTSPDVFTPATAGLDTVILIQTDNNNCIDTVSQSIYVYAPPAIFNIDTFICPGDTITLSPWPGANVAQWTPNYNISDTASFTPEVWPAVNTSYSFRVGSLPQCYVYDTVNVILSTTTVTADTAYPACLGLPSIFTASATAVNATISSYNWNFGDGAGLTGDTVSHIYTTYGTYHDTLIVISSRGCRDTAYSSTTVWDHPHAAFSVSLDSVCIGAPFSVTNHSSPGVSAGLDSFYFNFGYPPNGTTDTSAFTYYTAGNQTIGLVQIDSNQCKDSTTRHIKVHNLPVANFTYDTSCVKINNAYISTSMIGDGQITKYRWTVNGFPDSGNTDSINYIFQAPGGAQTICLTVLDTFGCQRDTCMNVFIVSNPTFNVAYDATLCAGSSDSVSITGLVSGAQWVPATWVSDPNSLNTVVTPLQTISYLVTVYYRNCIPVVDTVGIWVIDSVPVSASVYPENIVLGLSSNVTTTVRGAIDSIIWSPDSSLDCRNCMNPIASPQQTTTYTATIYYGKNGVVCSNTANVTITVFRSCDGSRIYVPNTFTPNNDGVDDVFRLQGQGISMVEYFRVYDQWGKKVYDAENVQDPNDAAWNGGLNNDNMNKPMNTGVYVYEFQIKCVTDQTVAGKGNITLLR
jgi:gliding motility-associated-like protein